jgi:signal peptidase
MTALRWIRRVLEGVLVLAALAVVVTAGITILAPALGGRALVVGGESMEPAIPLGALIVALPRADDEYAVGDVVTVEQGRATPYTHRITRFAELAGAPYIETKGDSNDEPDPAIVPLAAVIGRVDLSIPLLGYLWAFLGTVLGLVCFLSLATAALALTWLIDELEDRRTCEVCAAAATTAVPAPWVMAVEHGPGVGVVRAVEHGPAAAGASLAAIDDRTATIDDRTAAMDESAGAAEAADAPKRASTRRRARKAA